MGSCNCLVFCYRCVAVTGPNAQLCGVPVGRRVSALVLAVFSLLNCMPEVNVTVEDVTVSGGLGLTSADSDRRRRLNDSQAQVLNTLLLASM